VSKRWKAFILCMILVIVIDVITRITIGSTAKFMDLVIISVVTIWLGEEK
jgi:hypothetical protein